MQRNNALARLAKVATTIPLPVFTPTSSSSISLGGRKPPRLGEEMDCVPGTLPHALGGTLGHVAPTICATPPSRALVAVGQCPVARVLFSMPEH